LKGATLKNTEWILGFVVFTGEDTKLMQNSQKSRFKQSKMEIKMNRLIIYIVIVQACLCIIIAVVGSIWYKENDAENDYLPFDWAVGTDGVITYFSYFLLLNTMLPISLIVTLELVKVC
jgi:magnesium-transporting ATPase (P-type)